MFKVFFAYLIEYTDKIHECVSSRSKVHILRKYLKKTQASIWDTQILCLVMTIFVRRKTFVILSKF